MSFTATVSGVDELVAACDAVIAAITSSDTAAEAAALVGDAARPNVPVVTGRLASSEQITPTTTGATLEWAAPYALAVHARRPWLPAALAEAEAPITELYTSRIDAAWS